MDIFFLYYNVTLTVRYIANLFVHIDMAKHESSNLYPSILFYSMEMEIWHGRYEF